MTPDCREELRRCDDACYRTRTSRDMDELKSLLAEAGDALLIYMNKLGSSGAMPLVQRIHAIVPKTEEVKDE